MPLSPLPDGGDSGLATVDGELELGSLLELLFIDSSLHAGRWDAFLILCF